MTGGLIPNAHYAHLSFNLVVLWGHVQKQRQELFYKKAARKNVAIFTGKHLCRSLFLITRLSYNCYFIKRDSNSGFFLWITAFFWRTAVSASKIRYIMWYLHFYMINSYQTWQRGDFTVRGFHPKSYITLSTTRGNVGLRDRLQTYTYRNVYGCQT